MQKDEVQQYVGIWQLIPKNAFLYFPQGQQIRVGSGQKQWRKIFQGNQKFDQFEENALNKLQQKLVLSNIQVHPWFNKANKLRYLQANKWKKTPTCEAIAQYSRYRNSQFPIKQTHDILYMLNKGTFYLCGRDNQYRPIIIADLSKFQAKDIDLIPPTLVFLMEFLINYLLIQDQVQNYVLIMNLESFSMSQKGLVSKIVAFTSNSYRGRLFASYLLGAPYLLRVGWNTFASGFVSQNTLKKLKVTGDLSHEDMWTHVDKGIIQKKYGGVAANLTGNYWPPNAYKLLYESDKHPNRLINVEQYNKMFLNMQLQNRKVLKHLLRRKTITIRDENRSTIILEEVDPMIQSIKVLERIDRDSLTDATILIQSTIFPEDLKFIRPFFRNQRYLKIR